MHQLSNLTETTGYNHQPPQHTPEKPSYMNLFMLLGMIAILLGVGTSAMYLWDATTSDGIQAPDFFITIGGAAVLLALMACCAHVGFKTLPELHARQKYWVIAGFFAIQLIISLVSYTSSLSAMAEDPAQVAYLERQMREANDLASEKIEAINHLKADTAVINALIPATRELLSGERNFGNVSGLGGGTGKTASVIAGILSNLESAATELARSNSEVDAINRRIMMAQHRIVALAESDAPYYEREAQLRVLLLRLSVLSDELSEHMPVDLIRSTAESMSISFEAIGLTRQAVNILDQTYHVAATQLLEGLVAVDEVRKKSISEFETKDGMGVIFNEFNSVFLIILLCLLVEIATPAMIGLNLAIQSGLRHPETPTPITVVQSPLINGAGQFPHKPYKPTVVN